jgi:hypothetical protein
VGGREHCTSPAFRNGVHDKKKGQFKRGCQDYFISHIDVCGLTSPIVSRPKPAPDRCHQVDGSLRSSVGARNENRGQGFIARSNLCRVTVDILERMVGISSAFGCIVCGRMNDSRPSTGVAKRPNVGFFRFLSRSYRPRKKPCDKPHYFAFHPVPNE